MAEVTDEQRENGEPLETVVNAAKIAAVSAAVGAAAAAAKAFASRHDHEDDGEAADEQPDEQPRDEEPRDEEPQDEVEQQEPEPEPEPEPQMQQDAEEDEEEEEEEPVEGAALGDAQNAAERGRKQLEELLGKPVESVSSLERTHDGWVAALEVVELSRVPESTDVLASYEIELDEDLNFRRYQQVRRYTRSQASSGDE